MFEVRVEADFAAAHFLQDFHGKCERLHGHNYQVFAHARGTDLDEGGMLLDFGILKKELRSICKELDHSHLNENEFFENNPSAERIALYIFQKLESALQEYSPKTAALLYAVDVFETATSRARYTKDSFFL
jgi:6-pyruvoyltetrahydropterin/6-carboxytetrahydropterin synthase